MTDLTQETETRQRRKHGDVLRERLTLEGAKVADIGSGDGALVRSLTRNGAQAVGIEVSRLQIERAQKAEAVGGEQYLFGRAEALPFADGELDIVVFFNSLHHVPVEAQATALGEATRVLKPGGHVYILEPIAAGAYFELMRPVEDETFVRAKAYEALQAACADAALTLIEELHYEAPYKMDSFEAMIENKIAIDEKRRPKIEALHSYLKMGFEAAAEARDGAFWFYQPCRVNLLQRT